AVVERIGTVPQVDTVGIVGPVVGGQRVIAEELEQAAVIFAGAALGDHADGRAAGTAGLGAVQAAFHLELRDGVHTGEGHQRKVAAPVDVVRAVDRPVIGGVAIAVYEERHRRRQTGRRRVSNVQFVHRVRGNTRHQCNQLFVVASSQGELAYLRAVDRVG